MAFRNSAAQSIKEKDAKELIVLIKARDVDISRLSMKIKSLKDYQKRSLMRTERELQVAQAETKRTRSNLQALQVILDEAKNTEEQVCDVIEDQKEATQKQPSEYFTDAERLCYGFVRPAISEYSIEGLLYPSGIAVDCRMRRPHPMIFLCIPV